MSLYLTFLIIFGLTSLVGVPMLSFVQYMFIHGKTVSEWITGLPLTLLIVVILMAIIAVIMFFVMKPLSAVLEKAKKQDLEDNEKLVFLKVFKKMDIITTIVLMIGYVFGNLFILFIKTKKGLFVLGNTRFEAITTFCLILGLCLLYGFVARAYCTHMFQSIAQKQIEILKLRSMYNEKVEHFTAVLGFVSFLFALFTSGHILCCAYRGVRFGYESVSHFISLAIPVLCYSLLYPTPLLDYILVKLRKRFSRTTEVIKGIREDGNLATRLGIVAFDDFGETNSEVNGLIEYLNTTMRQIREQTVAMEISANDLLNNSENSSAGINQIVANFKDIDEKNDERDRLLESTKDNVLKLNNDAKRISELVASQTAATEENASAITEMVANINSIGEMVKRSQSLSENLAQLSETGNTEVTGTLNIITDITSKSQKMMEVVKVIQAVASQTNLLAMNAAIEAAHAGEAGSGFAVVADEIRKLAESTSKSTKDIKVMIEELSASISGSSEKINSTSKAFKQINDGISDQLQLVETIARATEEQRIGASETLKATNEVSDQIVEINTLMKKQADYSSEIENGIEDVVNLSTHVNTALKESNTVIQDFSSAIESNKNGAINNQESIKKVNTELNRFKLD